MVLKNKVKIYFHRVKSYVINSLQWFSQHPLYGVLVTVSGALTGLLGSLYSAEIKAADYFLFQNKEFSSPALTFWLSLIVLGILFYYRNYAEHAAHNKLVKLIKTTPSEAFLINFANIHQISYNSVWGGLKELSKFRNNNVPEIHSVELLE